VAVSADIERIIVDIERVPARKAVLIRNGVDTEKFCTRGQTPRPRDDGCRRGGNDNREDRDNDDNNVPGRTASEHSIAESSLSTLLSKRSELRSVRRIPADVFVVGTVGRLSAEKDYPLLVRAFARFRVRNPKSLLVIVGDGREEQAIRHAADECGVSEVCLLPGVQHDIPAWLQCMNVFCLSSEQEGTSVTLLEAGACGLPAVVTDVGGNGEVVQDEITGLVVPCGDADALSRAFERLAADASLREKMGRKARSRISEDYSVKRMVESYVEVYREVLGRSG